MTAIRTAFPLPEHEDDFDRLNRALFERHWGAQVQRHGRRGQAQQGVDFFGVDKQGGLHGGQSKLHEHRKDLKLKEVKAEIKKAKAFRPKLDDYVIATTARTDPAIQRYICRVSRLYCRRGLFSVSVFFWDNLVDLLGTYTDVADHFFGNPAFTQAVGDIKGHFDQQTGLIIQALGLGGGEEVDQAIEYTRANQPELAIALLERLRTKRWASLTERERYRVIANLGPQQDLWVHTTGSC